MPTVVLGVTGCIGAYKACEVLRELQRRGVDVHVVMTRHAAEFVTPMTFQAVSGHPVFLDQFALGAEGDIRPSAWPTRPSSCWWRRPPPTSSASSRAASRTMR
jgi:phosphopantothenoylcysteine decarboxylase/phosphopantothenate--cysteine ligase